jgi:tetratricopeptide (TPR) repeat protein
MGILADQAVLASKSIDEALAARIAFGRGWLALARSDHDGARAQYEAALTLYRHVGEVRGEADCIKGLGDIALARSDHLDARERYEAALTLYPDQGPVLDRMDAPALGRVDGR